RIGEELRREAGKRDAVDGFGGPSFEELDHAALRREVSRLRQQLAESEGRCAELAQQNADLECGRDGLREQVLRERAEASAEADRQYAGRTAAERELAAIRQSTSWHVTSPMRALRLAWLSMVRL